MYVAINHIEKQTHPHRIHVFSLNYFSKTQTTFSLGHDHNKEKASTFSSMDASTTRREHLRLNNVLWRWWPFEIIMNGSKSEICIVRSINVYSAKIYIILKNMLHDVDLVLKIMTMIAMMNNEIKKVGSCSSGRVKLFSHIICS